MKYVSLDKGVDSFVQPLTAKELEYMADSLSNEELLMKQCVATSVQSSSPQVKQLCNHVATRHMQHYQHMMQVMQQHVQMAPSAIQ